MSVNSISIAKEFTITEEELTRESLRASYWNSCACWRRNERPDAPSSA